MSSVEGFFESPSVWRGKAPALLVKEGRRVAPVYGELVEVTDEGIVFDPARVSPVDQPDRRLYRFEELQAAVDAEGHLIHREFRPGDVEEIAMNLIVVRAGDGRQRSIHLPLQPNRAFGYCLPPATYEIDGVLFSDSRNNVDRAVMVVPLRFSVSPGFANYLGTLTLGRASVEHPWQVVLPQQVHSAVYSAA